MRFFSLAFFFACFFVEGMSDPAETAGAPGTGAVRQERARSVAQLIRLHEEEVQDVERKAKSGFHVPGRTTPRVLVPPQLQSSARLAGVACSPRSPHSPACVLPPPTLPTFVQAAEALQTPLAVESTPTTAAPAASATKPSVLPLQMPVVLEQPQQQSHKSDLEDYEVSTVAHEKQTDGTDAVAEGADAGASAPVDEATAEVKPESETGNNEESCENSDSGNSSKKEDDEEAEEEKTEPKAVEHDEEKNEEKDEEKTTQESSTNSSSNGEEEMKEEREEEDDDEKGELQRELSTVTALEREISQLTSENETATRELELELGTTTGADAARTLQSRNCCAVCGRRVLLGAYYDLGDGSRAHVECFCCARCRTPLTTFRCIDGAYVCAACAHALRPPPQCAACGRAIADGESVVALGREWHAACFCCAHCGRQLRDAFAELHGRPYCPPCDAPCVRIARGKVCSVCAGVLDSSYLTVLNRCCHRACFCCSGCGVPFPSLEFFQVDNQPFCETCAVQLISAQLHAPQG